MASNRLRLKSPGTKPVHVTDYTYRYCAPSKAWRLLRGGSPRRKSLEGGSLTVQELATRFVPSLAAVKERSKQLNDTGEA